MRTHEGNFRKTPDGILKPSGVCQLDISVWIVMGYYFNVKL